MSSVCCVVQVSLNNIFKDKQANKNSAELLQCIFPSFSLTFTLDCTAAVFSIMGNRTATLYARVRFSHYYQFY